MELTLINATGQDIAYSFNQSVVQVNLNFKTASRITKE
jgi:hypothetical protein